MKFLYAAYAATWIIHAVYLVSVVRRYGRLRRELVDLHKPGSTTSR